MGFPKPAVADRRGHRCPDSVPVEQAPARSHMADRAEPPANLQPSQPPDLCSTQKLGAPLSTLNWECLMQSPALAGCGNKWRNDRNGMLVTTPFSPPQRTDTATRLGEESRQASHPADSTLIHRPQNQGPESQSPVLPDVQGPPSGGAMHPPACHPQAPQERHRHIIAHTAVLTGASWQLPAYR